ncbi:MAG: exodeoxyribonuclease VII large subunit [Planctomycetota bacterium]
MKNVRTISQLTRLIKAQLNNQFPAVWVSGEISGISQPGSGHLYFTLKDAHAQINAIIWRDDANELPFKPTNGMKVICRGGVDVYPQRGSYQLIIRKIQPQGVGSLELALRQLQQKLAKAGLFDDRHKQSLPMIPQHIALITSPTGAAIRDFLQVISRRWPNLRVTIVPVRVQGAGAAEEIANGIALCHTFASRPDAIVLTRGGGSIEDLWAFNEEVTVRAIFDAQIPIVSGVGHEIDVTLADLAADVRALTPSEAAERLVPNLADVKELLEAGRQRLQQSIRLRMVNARQQLEQLASRPVITQPLQRIRNSEMELDFLHQRLSRSMESNLKAKQQTVARLAGQLNAINPLAVLARGYSLTMDSDGRTISDCHSVATGDTIATRLENGTIFSSVNRIENNTRGENLTED